MEYHRAIAEHTNLLAQLEDAKANHAKLLARLGVQHMGINTVVRECPTCPVALNFWHDICKVIVMNIADMVCQIEKWRFNAREVAFNGWRAYARKRATIRKRGRAMKEFRGFLKRAHKVSLLSLVTDCCYHRDLCYRAACWHCFVTKLTCRTASVMLPLSRLFRRS